MVPFTNDDLQNYSLKIDQMDVNAQTCEGSFSGLLTSVYETWDTYELITETATITGTFKGNTFALKGE